MKRILVCEDELDAQASIKNMLTRRNYEVFSASDGQAAIEQARELKPDVVLLDIRMPKIDGIEVAREIRTFDKLMKIIVVTAFASPEIQKEISRYGVSEYIVKPASADSIVTALESALK